MFEASLKPTLFFFLLSFFKTFRENQAYCVIFSVRISLGVLGRAWACLGVLGRAWACLGMLGCAWACFRVTFEAIFC